MALVLLLAGLSVLAVRPLRGPARLEIGAFAGGALTGAWSPSTRADIDPQAATDSRTSFYYRAAPPNSGVALPVTARGGSLRLTMRATARVRSALGVFLAGERTGEILMTPGPWTLYDLDIPAPPRDSPLVLGLALRPLPLVRGSHVEDPEILLDYLEIEAPGGLALSPWARLLVALVPLSVFTFGFLIGLGPAGALSGALLSAVAVVLIVRAAPFSTVMAIPRLLPVALVTALVVHLLLKRKAAGLAAAERARLAALVAAGILFHGSLAFFPDHSPPDIDIHVRRTLDLGQVPLDYQAVLRYGSQLPTASQEQGQATAALGDRTLIPYSPLPYLLYYAAHRVGLDLYWGMTALNAALAMAVAPWLWVVADRLWNRPAAWTAALLYTLDLAVWHHLGRSHAPAVFGGALGTAGLLYLALRADRLDAPRRAAVAGLVLGIAALGYSSLVVLLGLFGLVLLALLVTDARGLSPAARQGVARALLIAGISAGALFYFHYVPGLLHGASGVEAEPDLFPGKTFLIFHNESRQSLRLWVLGYWIPLFAGLAAAPLALLRAKPGARSVLLAWLAAWALFMLLKEPFLFPRLLRWAKEDQFLSPLLGLFIAAAVWALPRAWMRWGAAALVIATAVWLQLRDFAHHANSLRL